MSSAETSERARSKPELSTLLESGTWLESGTCYFALTAVAGAGSLPALMNQRADLRVVSSLDGTHRAFGERRQIGGRAVVGGLRRALGAGNGAGDGVEHQDPAECELRHAHAGRHLTADFFHGAEPGLIIDARKGLADVEGFAVTIEVAMIVGREHGSGRHLSGQHAARQRNARQDADLFFHGPLEEKIGRQLAEAVEDDLHRLHAGELEGLESFLDALHADAVIADLAGL